ncbi:hypothetical protein [Streptomyces melanosporofaciens]|uniref:Uncharacterized protein n=1 Tax=Streptomyces melanosporofaciens TaxID=67327 RepID=A0A1H4KQ30_STRMJ|nr:hypothetical protein [Streptomyces melanosporofaciens]SEB60208.1 hypothetical protein SAMN04490356_0873 [Streptomyces melanosporofaciens]
MRSSLAEFKRRAQNCTAFQCVNHKHPHLSGPRTIRSIGPRTIPYAIEGFPNTGRTEWPKAGLYRIEGNKITWLHDGDGSDCFTYIFPFDSDAEPRHLAPEQANALLAGAIAVGEHQPNGVTVWHHDGWRYPVTWGGTPPATLPGELIDAHVLATGSGTYHVDLSVGGTAWYRTLEPAVPRLLLTDVTHSERDGARFTREGWTLYVAYASGLCVRLTPTGLDGQLVDLALLVTTQGLGWDDSGVALDMAERVLKTAGLH